MQRLLFTLIFACSFGIIDAAAQTGVPANLDAAVAALKKEWTRGELDSFKAESEELAVMHQHYASGSWIRSTWIQTSVSSPLRAYFESQGITHADDMSSIILTSLHRSLNGKDQQLAKQTERYKNYWKSIDECDGKLKANAAAVYGKFKEFDMVTIYFPVDTAYGQRNAITYNCPKPEWKFDAKRDLILKGQIVKKYMINETSGGFEVRVTELNRNDTPIFHTPVHVGDTKRLPLYSLRVE